MFEGSQGGHKNHLSYSTSNVHVNTRVVVHETFISLRGGL